MLAYASEQTSLVTGWLLAAQVKSSGRQVSNEQHTCNMLVQLMTVKLQTCGKQMAVWAGGSGIRFLAAAREFVFSAMCRLALRTPQASYSINTAVSYP